MKITRVTILAGLLFLLPQGLWAGWTEFFTDVMVAGGSKSVRNQEGWKSYDRDLNDGAGGDYIYLLYKQATTETPSQGFITDLKVVHGNYQEKFTDSDGVEWILAPYTGGDHFKGLKGDLNSNAGGASIHLFYTRHEFADHRVVTSVYFNSTSVGSVGDDLNRGAGGDDIYMHVRYSNKGEGLFDTPSEAFTYNTSARGCMHFKLLTSDYDPFRTLHEAVYSLKDADGKKIEIFKIDEEYSSNTLDYVRAYFQSMQSEESVLFLTNSQQYSPKLCLVTGNEKQHLYFYRNDGKGRTSGNGYAELDWYYPSSVAGKKYMLTVSGKLYYDGGHYEDYTRDIGNIEFDEIAFEAYDAVIGTDPGEEGKIKIPCVSDHAISWLQAIYTGSDNQENKMDKVTLKDNNYAGFVLLPANDTHKKVVINAGIVMATWDKDKLGNPDWPTSNSNTVSITLNDVPMMHDSRNLTATVDQQGAVILNWKISDLKYPDILDGDQFLIQRSLPGLEDDFRDIGSIMVDVDQESYSFKDSLLVSSLTKDYIDASSGKPKVMYRVLRASTQQLWGVTNNPTLNNISPVFQKLALLHPIQATADWSNRNESKILIKWNYAKDEQQYNFVWDERAEMRLEIDMTNREGKSLGKTSTVLTAEQIAAGQLETVLHRSCTKYHPRIVVNAKESPLPIVGYDFTNVETPVDAFFYENNGHINKSSLSAATHQSSVVLTWTTDGGAIDYFIVKRRDQAKAKDAWETVATQITDTQYEDKTTAPRHKYDYCVLAANNCEGMDYQSTDTIPGQCSEKGTIAGFVRFPDGSGIPGITVNISSTDGSIQETAETDESGYFRKEGLPYWGESFSGAYRLAPNLKGYSDQKMISFGTKPGTNLINNVVFYVENSVRFAGFVLYNGTSIPVQDVSFLVDGREVRTASGKVTTDFEGKFSFRMLPGKHTIQAAKDGHTFYQEGFYYEGNNTSEKEHDFTIDKAGVYFYDDTRVKLIGRVAGGKDQEAFPLDNSLSRNNLGDDLRLVFTLEGDRASRLVWDIQDTQRKENDEEFPHQSHDGKDYKTTVHTTISRKVVTPDVRTGEYVVYLPPVKWKIEQITARGYATLFQDGHTSDVIDLTDSLTLHTDVVKGKWRTTNGEDLTQVEVKYHAKYNRIYHAPVNIGYKQIGYDTFDYLGNRYYTAKGLDGTSTKVELVRPVRKKGWPVGVRDSMRADYTFGYPVFNIERTYPLRISATERYYYNNNQQSDTIDVVRLSGGRVTIQNGFVSSTHCDVIELDSVGEYTYQLAAKQIPYLITGKQALRTVTMTLEMDGTHYEADPLRAYILNIAPMSTARDVMSVGKPVLVDILRDPPGCGSSAKLSKGSTLTSTFNLTMKMQRGATLDVGIGTEWDTWAGVGAGIWQKANSAFNVDLALVWNNNSELAYNYTMTANTDISTSSNHYVVGADGDVYMGLNTNIIMKPAVAIRAINDSIYQTMKGAEKAGRLLVIAQGIDSLTKKPVYLVRSETMAVGQELESTFAHSQQYIIKQMLPEMEEQCRSMMFIGTKAEAQRQANATGKPVYLSLRKPDDPYFAVMNTRKQLNKGDKEWETFYNYDDFEAKEGVNYVVIRPAGSTLTDIDEVMDYYQSMMYWIAMIAQNEREKLEARTLMKNFDVDGATGLTYSEEFSSQLSAADSNTNITTDFKYGATYADAMAGLGIAFNSVATTIANFGLSKLFNGLLKNYFDQGNKNGDNEHEVTMTGWKWHLRVVPVLSANFTPKYGTTEKFSRKETFTISMDRLSHLNFDVYYADTTINHTGKSDWNDVFVNDKFVDYDHEVVKQIFNKESNLRNNTQQKRGFIYRTRAGATLRTWEDERRTMFYNTGSILDERTKKMENPVIKMDKQSVSGVPFGEPARFKLYLTNESEQPEAYYPYFSLTMRDNSNPNGAKIMMDGMPLAGTQRNVVVLPGQVTEKTIEVYASEAFDYENLRLRLGSLDDTNTWQEATFSVHFLQQAGNISITNPGDKWIMNTDAPYDSKRGWYLPIIISDFNRNQQNFDHIEFQYKESTRGDDYWTNLCSFYADSTYYEMASGTKEMIPANGNITTKFYGEGTVMEKAYDLRAVLFCRNGNGYLTNSSKVLTGVKDTRRPQLFSTPEPKDGVLDVGEDIVFSFSEPIEYNYLQPTTNFEVKGETNENALEESVSLSFNGSGAAESDARRNFSDKSVTIEVMVKPDGTNKEMPIFSHGSDGHKLQLWLTKERLLRAVIDDKTMEGKTPISTDAFTRVALVIDNDKHTALLYANALEAKTEDVSYAGSGTIVFGATNQTDVTKRSFYSGRMLQGRIWNRALDLVLLNSYGNKLLTGYEMGLSDYYPMNEGAGSIAQDQAQGAHLRLNNVDWSMPRNMSLKLDFNQQQSDGTKGLKLRNEFFTRDSEQDYTLMFWFKTNESGRGALLSNGSGRATDVEAENCFFIGFEADTLKYRANGVEHALGTTFSDNKWHHYAMTMNHARQIANIYVDFTQKASFSTEHIGGMGGDHFYLGNMVWTEQGADNDKLHQQNALSGGIDGLTLFEQALPVTLVERYGRKGLSGKEKGLITYLDFCRQERQKNGELLLVPYAKNKVVKFDADGNVSERNDTVFVLSPDVIMTYIDQANGAPVQPYEELRELKFSYVGSNHQLMMTVDELDSRINKRHVYVTVCDIPDKNGNVMASPNTISLFVDRNPLRWSRRTLECKGVPSGIEATFSVNIINNSGVNHVYTINNLPRWLSVNVPTDMIAAKEEREITFSISKDVNVGEYDDIIYLTDEDGLAEPLSVYIEVEGEEPQWQPNIDRSQYSMNIVARIQIKDDIVTDSRDLVGVFDYEGHCLGSIHVDYDVTTDEGMAYLTVYEEEVDNEHPLTFKLWHYRTGKAMMLTPSEKIYFKPNSTIGTTKNPILLRAEDEYIQQIDLVKGWNWVSFNVYSNNFRAGKEMLNRYRWMDGDMIVDDAKTLVLRYEAGDWISNKGTNGVSNFMLSISQSYRIKAMEARSIEVAGSILRQPIYRKMTVKKGWNSIGYTPTLNLPIATALADYFDEAEDGDVVKNRTEFAMFTVGSNGSKGWKGNLRYMKPGEGYMLCRKKETTVSFTYPFYEPNAMFFEDNGAQSREFSEDLAEYANTMSLTATVDGIDVEEGDRLLAMNGAEIVGTTSVADGSAVYYMSIAGEQKQPVSFAIERNGDIIATTGDVLVYEPNAISGSPNEPTVISFVRTDHLPQDGWYTLQGVKLQQAPAQPGVYIYNGKKQVVK